MLRVNKCIEQFASCFLRMCGVCLEFEVAALGREHPPILALNQQWRGVLVSIRAHLAVRFGAPTKLTTFRHCDTADFWAKPVFWIAPFAQLYCYIAQMIVGHGHASTRSHLLAIPTRSRARAQVTIWLQHSAESPARLALFTF